MPGSPGPNFGLYFGYTPGDDGWGTEQNENLRRIDFVLPNIIVESETVNNPPGSPAQGVAYIVGTSPTGAWAGHARELTRWRGSAWEFFAPAHGWTALVKDSGRPRYYNGTVWRPVVDYPPGFISGLQLEWVSNSQVRVNVGSCRGDSDQRNIDVAAPLTADITVSGAGGRDTGSEAASTWYAVWVIDDPNGTVPTAALLSTSFTAPVMPSGYTRKRRVGCVRNNSSSNFRKFFMTGGTRDRFYLYDDEVSNLTALSAGNATTFTAVSLATFLPVTAKVAQLLLGLTTTTAAQYASVRPDGSTAANPPVFYRPGSALTSSGTVQFLAVAGTSQQVNYLVSASAAALDIVVSGFVDEL